MEWIDRIIWSFRHLWEVKAHWSSTVWASQWFSVQPHLNLVEKRRSTVKASQWKDRWGLCWPPSPFQGQTEGSPIYWNHWFMMWWTEKEYLKSCWSWSTPPYFGFSLYLLAWSFVVSMTEWIKWRVMNKKINEKELKICLVCISFDILFLIINRLDLNLKSVNTCDKKNFNMKIENYSIICDHLWRIILIIQ